MNEHQMIKVLFFRVRGHEQMCVRIKISIMFDKYSFILAFHIGYIFHMKNYVNNIWLPTVLLLNYQFTVIQHDLCDSWCIFCATGKLDRNRKEKKKKEKKRTANLCCL